MDIKVYNSLEQIDLGVVQPELPPLRFLKEFAAAAPGPPPQIIEGIMHQGCKLVLGGARARAIRAGACSTWP